MLCLFGFLKDIRPSEPFVTDFMQLPYRNVTSDEVNEKYSKTKNLNQNKFVYN